METPDLPLIPDYLRWYATRTPAATFAIEEERRLSYAETADEVDRWAAALVGAGIRPGDRVGVFGDPCPEFLVALLAILSVGGVYVGLNPKYTEGELEHVVSDSGARLLLGIAADRPEQAAKLEALRDTVPTVERVALLDAAGPARPAPTEDLERFLVENAASAAELAVARLDRSPSEPAAIVYTSGSTGRPKGAVITQRGFVAAARTHAHHLLDTRASTTCDLAINHVGCLVYEVFQTLACGGRLVCRRRFDPAGVLRTIEEHELAFWAAFPTMFLLSIQTVEWRTTDLSSLQRVFWSGARASDDILAALRGTGARLLTGWGLTEATGGVTFTREGADDRTLTETVGQPADGYELEVRDEHGRVCAVGEPGELCVRSVTITAGYLNRPEASAEAIDSGGWLRSGDMGTLDEDGNVRLVGRSSEMYKSGGYNVYPREVEIALEEHDAVTLAAVISIDDPVWGEVGHAFVAAAEGTTVDPDELREWARGSLANYKLPKRLYVEDELPMLSNGKVDKKELRRLARERLEVEA